MSIADELRKYAQDWRDTPNLMDDLDAGDVDGILADFEHIADRIDAEHEKAMSRAGQLLADAEKDRDYNYAQWQECKQNALQHNITIDELYARIECLEDELSHCIKLPKDADGVPIHVGDWITGRWDAKAKVVAVTSDDVYWWEPDGCHWCHAFEVRHYHAPTVEDVLREFAERYLDYEGVPSAGRRGIGEALMDEYAAKLRLAGETE